MDKTNSTGTGAASASSAASGGGAPSKRKPLFGRAAFRIGLAGIALALAAGLGLTRVASWSADDAVVQGRTAVLAAPIEGVVSEVTVAPGDLVRQGDPLARLINPRIDRGHLARLKAEKAQLGRRIAALEEERDGLREIAARLERTAESTRQATVRILDQRAQARAADLTAARARLAAARSAHARQTALAAKGHATQRAVDDAAAELAVWTQRAEALKAEIALIEEERRQAANGLYLSDGRMGAAYAHVRGDEVAIRMLELSTRLEGVRARRDELGLQVALEEERVRHVAASRLEAPFDGVVWKVLAAENGAVGAGSGMIQMIDCESTYLEVQVSERRFERVAAGDPLYYRLLGEEHWRTGQVAALRGGGVHQDAITLAAGLEESGGLRVMASFAADHQPGQAAFCDVGRRVEVRFGTPDAGAAMTQLVQRARGLLDAGFAMVIPTAQAAARHISSLVE